MQHLQKVIAVLRVLQIGELVLQRRSDSLNGVAEQVEQQEALHLKGDIGIDHDPHVVERMPRMATLTSARAVDVTAHRARRTDGRARGVTGAALRTSLAIVRGRPGVHSSRS